jgi:hypothetical protein
MDAKEIRDVVLRAGLSTSLAPLAPLPKERQTNPRGKE